MKRTLCILTAALLALSLAGPAYAESEIFKTAYYTLSLPAGWEISMEDLEKEDDYEYLGCFGAPDEVGLVIYATLEYYDDLKDISLWSVSEAELQEYTDTVLEEFEDYDPELLGTVMAGSVPFVLVRGTDEDGDFLYADTMTNGYAIIFQAFVLDYDAEKQYPVTDEHVEQLKQILMTFTPVA